MKRSDRMKRVRWIGGLGVLIISSLSFSSSSGQDLTHVQWVREALKAMQAVKAGMTRAGLERVFEPDGGFSSGKDETYVYRGCALFKVDVRLEPDPANPGRENDKIVTISRPYLEWPRLD